MTGRTGLPRACRAAGLVLLGLSACDRRAERHEGALVDMPLPCESQGYPCTWNEVDPEIVERTKRLGAVAARYSLAAPSLDSIAGLLRAVPGLAEVAIDGRGVRFRLDGGRPAWVFLPDELDHHRPDSVRRLRIGQRDSRSDTMPGRVAPSRSLAAIGSALGTALLPRPLHAAQAADGARVAGEPGEGKKALILSPFDYEWADLGYSNSLGADFTRRTRLIKDYREVHGGEVTYRADLSKLSDNPAVPGREQRTIGGRSMLSGEVVFDDFLGWDKRKLNLIILASHGTAVSCSRKPPVGGAAPERYTGPEGKLCPLIYAGRAKQEEYGSHLGVEIYLTANYSWMRPPDPTTRFDTPGEIGWRDTRPDLSAAEAATCAQKIAAGEKQATTDAGLPCGDPKWEHDYAYLVLWWPFFEEQYPGGLEKAIVFLGACFSGINDVLPDILAPAGNEAITVFGFDKNVSAGDAWDVIGEMLDLIDDGYHSKELIRRLKALDRTMHLVGKAMDLDRQTLPAAPAEILEKRTHATHGRDVVQLVDPVSGQELVDRGMVTVLGAPGDGHADSLRLRARIIGVAADDPIDAVRLFAYPRGSPSDRPYVPAKRVRKGVYEYDGDVHLGRDHAEGEITDLEVRAEFPGGGESRWIYRDVRLGGAYWSMRMSGVRSGEFGGSYATALARPSGIVAINLRSDTGDPFNLIAITFGIRSPLTATGTFSPGGGVSVGLDLDKANSGGADGFCTRANTPGYPEPPTVTIESFTADHVTGSVTGTVYRCDPGHKPAEQSSVRIDFAATVCSPGIGGKPCRR